MLEIGLLGGLDVIRDGTTTTLPPSRNTRALCASLALTRCPHRRERLCEHGLGCAEDPRGSLRWSLSKIRSLVGDPAFPRLVTDRQSVEPHTEAFDSTSFHRKACARAKMTVPCALMRTRLLPDAVSRVAPSNPHAFPRIRIWRGRRVLAHATYVLGRATATSKEAPNDEQDHGPDNCAD